MFNFNRLDVYGCAIEFFKLAIPLTERAPVGFHSLNDQLRRAAVSIPLNIAAISQPEAAHAKSPPGAHRVDADQAINGQVSVAYANVNADADENAASA